MGLTILWTEFAMLQLEQIFHYYNQRASRTVANRISQRIFEAPNQLANQPLIGQIEPFLEDRPECFRYIIEGNYKLIYWVKDERVIEIIDVFDTRQNPGKMKRNK